MSSSNNLTNESKSKLIDSRYKTALYPIGNLLNPSQYHNQNDHSNNDRKLNDESSSMITKKSYKTKDTSSSTTTSIFSNKFILNQINQERQTSRATNAKDSTKNSPKNQIFYNDVYNGSFNDLPNIDRNVLVNSTLSTYNVLNFNVDSYKAM